MRSSFFSSVFQSPDLTIPGALHKHPPTNPMVATPDLSSRRLNPTSNAINSSRFRRSLLHAAKPPSTGEMRAVSLERGG